MPRRQSATVRKYKKNDKVKVNTSLKLLEKKVEGLIQVRETKLFSIAPSNFPHVVGQVLFNSTGHGIYEISPYIIQGTGFSNRVGNVITILKSRYQFQFYQMSATASNVRVKILLYETEGIPESIITQATVLLNPNVWLNSYNAFSNIRDFNSAFNPDGKRAYKLIKTKFINVKMDGTSPQIVVADSSMTITKPYKVVFDQNTNNMRTGQRFIIVLCDNGNASAVNSSTLYGLPNPQINSGLMFNFKVDFYYNDS